MWYKRPCPVPLLKVMALAVIHLTPLRLVLLDTLMTDYMVLVDSYLSSSLYEPDGLEHVTMVSHYIFHPLHITHYFSKKVCQDSIQDKII